MQSADNTDSLLHPDDAERIANSNADAVLRRDTVSDPFGPRAGEPDPRTRKRSSVGLTGAIPAPRPQLSPDSVSPIYGDPLAPALPHGLMSEPSSPTHYSEIVPAPPTTTVTPSAARVNKATSTYTKCDAPPKKQSRGVVTDGISVTTLTELRTTINSFFRPGNAVHTFMQELLINYNYQIVPIRAYLAFEGEHTQAFKRLDRIPSEIRTQITALLDVETINTLKEKFKSKHARHADDIEIFVKMYLELLELAMRCKPKCATDTAVRARPSSGSYVSMLVGGKTKRIGPNPIAPGPAPVLRDIVDATSRSVFDQLHMENTSPVRWTREQAKDMDVGRLKPVSSKAVAGKVTVRNVDTYDIRKPETISNNESKTKRKDNTYTIFAAVSVATWRVKGEKNVRSAFLFVYEGWSVYKGEWFTLQEILAMPRNDAVRNERWKHIEQLKDLLEAYGMSAIEERIVVLPEFYPVVHAIHDNALWHFDMPHDFPINTLALQDPRDIPGINIDAKIYPASDIAPARAAPVAATAAPVAATAAPVAATAAPAAAAAAPPAAVASSSQYGSTDLSVKSEMGPRAHGRVRVHNPNKRITVIGHARREDIDKSDRRKFIGNDATTLLRYLVQIRDAKTGAIVEKWLSSMAFRSPDIASEADLNAYRNFYKMVFEVSIKDDSSHTFTAEQLNDLHRNYIHSGRNNKAHIRIGYDNLYEEEYRAYDAARKAGAIPSEAIPTGPDDQSTTASLVLGIMDLGEKRPLPEGGKPAAGSETKCARLTGDLTRPLDRYPPHQHAVLLEQVTPCGTATSPPTPLLTPDHICQNGIDSPCDTRFSSVSNAAVILKRFSISTFPSPPERTIIANIANSMWRKLDTSQTDLDILDIVCDALIQTALPNIDVIRTRTIKTNLYKQVRRTICARKAVRSLLPVESNDEDRATVKATVEYLFDRREFDDNEVERLCEPICKVIMAMPPVPVDVKSNTEDVVDCFVQIRAVSGPYTHLARDTDQMLGFIQKERPGSRDISVDDFAMSYVLIHQNDGGDTLMNGV